MEAIRVSNLSKTYYGATHAVNGLSLTVEAGDIYGFVGRNGAGKSTVMKMLCGALLPTAGEIEVLGERQLPGCSSRRLGCIVETPGIHPNLSGLDNVMCRALALGVVSPKLKSLEALEFVGLESVAKKRAKAYSLGMKQKLGLALALVGSPDVLLLDEPFNGLDLKSVRDIRALLVRLNKVRGVTVFISSHVLDQLERLVTRYGVIRDGRLVREISAEEVARECADCLRVRCGNPELALAALQKAYPDATYTLTEDDVICITGELESEAVSEVLARESVLMSELCRHERDIEDLFVELMGDKGTASGRSTRTVARDAAKHAESSKGGGRDA